VILPPLVFPEKTLQYYTFLMINVFFDMEIADALKLSSAFIATFFKHQGLYYKTFLRP
jgi:hypothetical protein